MEQIHRGQAKGHHLEHCFVNDRTETQHLETDSPAMLHGSRAECLPCTWFPATKLQRNRAPGYEHPQVTSQYCHRNIRHSMTPTFQLKCMCSTRARDESVTSRNHTRPVSCALILFSSCGYSMFILPSDRYKHHVTQISFLRILLHKRPTQA